MAKLFVLCLLALALITASKSKISVAAAVDEDGDLQQRQETLAEVLRVFSNAASAAAADSETVHRAASFLKREMGPLAPIFRAIKKMPENSIKEKSFDAAQELMHAHLQQLLVPHASTDTDDDDDDLPQRQQAMAEVVEFGAHPASVAALDAETLHRLGSFLKREMGQLQDILIAILMMPENSAKDEAFDGAMELLDRKFRLLLPHGGHKTDEDIGFAIGKMPETSAAEVRSKAEARAALKEIVSSHLLPHGGSFHINDDL